MIPGMTNRAPLAPDEWYHCFNRGVDKRRVFESRKDYERFIQALYLCNNTKRAHWDDIDKKSHTEILLKGRGKPLVSIAAYSLMPNHFHLLIKSVEENGISKFMQKLGVAYTMYFNKKNGRNGNLFTRPFRSRHVVDDRYFRRVVQYIHLNAAELFEPGWKEGRVKDFSNFKKQLCRYAYSSLPDYEQVSRTERALLDKDALGFVKDSLPNFSAILEDAAKYYRELRWTNR